MPLRIEDRTWITNQIRTAIDEYLNPHGWRKAREFIPLAAILSIFLGLLGLAGAGWHDSFSRVDKEARFEQNTTDRLSEIEAQLRLLRASSQPREVIKEMSTLDQAQFVRSLPALRKAQEQTIEDIKPLAPELRAISAKLGETDPNAPEYWPTVLQFLNFASIGISTNVPPPGPPFLASKGSLIGGSFNGITVLLDGGSVTDATFTNSRITFTENPVRLNKVNFINCVFEMPKTNTPAPYLQNAAKVLLASSLDSVSFNNI